jgi:RNA polymerase sigma-70 factor (ECF subfamily)
LTARDISTDTGVAALERLCRSYWRPLYFFARRKGHSPHDAEDLVQGFFSKLLEKEYLRAITGVSGRFRCFLLSAFSNYMANEWDRVRRLKRGGHMTFVSMDAATVEEWYLLEPSDGLTPEVLYDRRWASTITSMVTNRLKAEYADAGDSHRFAALENCLIGEANNVRYAEIGQQLGLSEGGVKTLVRRLRLRFAVLLREELLTTLTDASDVDSEMRHLLEALVV